MRDVGLLEVNSIATGGVGRPQHRYALAADAPRLGLEPPAQPLLAAMLVDLAVEAGLSGEAAVAAGDRQGRADADHARGTPCPEALISELDRLGFDPAVEIGDGTTTVTFGHCPFRHLAEQQPELVCGMHRGMVEGFVRELGGDVESFGSLATHDRCRVALRSGPPVAS
jgi:predicted ArsR family transcriptional regulator